MYRGIKLNLVDAGTPNAHYWYMLPEVGEVRISATVESAKRAINLYFRFLRDLVG